MISGPAYKLDYAYAMALSGDDLFVANLYGGSVTELNASTGSLVRVLAGSPYNFVDPDGMALSGDDLFVANAGDGSVTELPASAQALHPPSSGSD